MSVDVDAVVGAVRSVVGDRTVRLHEPDILPLSMKDVHNVTIDDAVGYKYIAELEADLAARCRRRYAIVVSSGTAALHLALLAAGVKPGDEVIVPAMTFVAAANAVTYCGAAPMIADVNHDGLSGQYADAPLLGYLMDSIPYEGSRWASNGNRIAAIVVVHLLGVPCDIRAAAEMAKGYGIPLIEDAAEALGSTTGGHPCGSFGDVSIMSFNNNKIVTSGGGGAVLTDDAEIADRVRHLASTAKQPSPFFYEHDAVGFNYRMPNLCAALALGQLRRLASLVELKRALALRYARAFDKIDGVSFMFDPFGSSSNCWLNAISVEYGARDAVLFALENAGIPCRALFTPLHRQTPYADAPRITGRGATSEFLFDRIVCLPSGPNL